MKNFILFSPFRETDLSERLANETCISSVCFKYRIEQAESMEEALKLASINSYVGDLSPYKCYFDIFDFIVEAKYTFPEYIGGEMYPHAIFLVETLRKISCNTREDLSPPRTEYSFVQ